MAMPKTQTPPSPLWADLLARLAGAMILILVGGAALFAGGNWFAFLTLTLAFIAILELSMLFLAKDMDRESAALRAFPISLAVAVSLLSSFFFPFTAPLMLFLPICIAALLLRARQLIPFALLTTFLMLAAFGLILFRENAGVLPTLWVIGCVALADTGGYFAGRIFGGPKLWPRLSPNKTWAGIFGGWALALIWGALLAYAFGWDLKYFLPESLIIAIIAQAGDLSESAIKRKTESKDSGKIIPGHGGILDRFDGLAAVSFVIFLSWPIWLHLEWAAQ